MKDISTLLSEYLPCPREHCSRKIGVVECADVRFSAGWRGGEWRLHCWTPGNAPINLICSSRHRQAGLAKDLPPELREAFGVWDFWVDPDLEDRRTPKRDEAEAFLREVLEDCSVHEDPLLREAVKRGISLADLRRAAKHIGVETSQDGAGGWWWKCDFLTPEERAFALRSRNRREDAGVQL